MSKCEHGLTSKECYVCASPKCGDAQQGEAEPLRLANDIDPMTRKSLDNLTCATAAAELRRLHEVEKQRDELLAALKEITPNMPPPDAPCHYGIVPQSSCARCQRIARSIAAIAKAEEKS